MLFEAATRHRHAGIGVVILAVSTIAPFLAPRPADAVTAPSFATFAAPAPLGRNAGEPSIGVNWTTGNVMVQAGLETLRVGNFNVTAATATWESVGSAITSQATLAPILFTDHRTNRTFVSQLAGACSLLAFTDDDGANWIQNPIGCGPAAGVEHQTVGGGPFAPGLSGIGYPDSVYYCAQAIVTAQCSLSVNGGFSFNPAVPTYNATQCAGLHGHLRAAPDGTVYVPNADCKGKQGVVVSANNGTNWTVRAIPVSNTQRESDPSVAVGAAGTVYFGFQGADGHAWAAVSRDRGRTWTSFTDVGASLGIQNVQFPAVIAGDDQRAAFAFLGTTTPGDDQKETFSGVWHLYVAATYDGGATWRTVDATPADPVQRGPICMSGGACESHRNLLDFIDVTVDKQGRVLVAYADGCVDACVTGSGPSDQAVATIARQSGGTGLLAAFDSGWATVPGSPVLSGSAGDAVAHLTWTAPADGGSAISTYKVYRGPASGGETLLATLGSVTSYDDTAVANGTTYHYRVSAANGVGEGPASNEVSLTPQGSGSPPSAPLNLKATTARGKRRGVILSWQAPASSGSSPVTGYRIYRGTASRAETFLVAVGTVTGYNDRTTTNGVRYYYRVTAANAAGEGPSSNEASAIAR